MTFLYVLCHFSFNCLFYISKSFFILYLSQHTIMTVKFTNSVYYLFMILVGGILTHIVVYRCKLENLMINVLKKWKYEVANWQTLDFWNKHKQKMMEWTYAHTTMVFFLIGFLLLVCCNWLVVIGFLSLVIIIGLPSLVCCHWFVVVFVLLLVHCRWFVIDSLSLLVHHCVVYCCPWCGCAIWFLHMLVLGCLSSAIVVQ